MKADGSALFTGDITCENPSGESTLIGNRGRIALQRVDTSPALEIWNSSGSVTSDTGSVKLYSDGSGEFAGPLTIAPDAGGNIKMYQYSESENSSGIMLVSDTYASSVRIQNKTVTPSTSNALSIYNGPNIAYKISCKGDTTLRSVVINLEPDNDANYVTTTDVDEEGNTVENRVYNGPTLDVKAVIQELQQRVADRDAVIADFTTRLAALEADHATLMSNNGGSY